MVISLLGGIQQRYRHFSLSILRTQPKLSIRDKVSISAVAHPGGIQLICVMVAVRSIVLCNVVLSYIILTTVVEHCCAV